MLFFALLLICLGISVEGNESWTLGLGQRQKFASPNYPEDAPANLKKTWAFQTQSGQKIKVVCKDFRFFETDPCGDYAVTFADGSGSKEFCGVNFDLTRVSTGSSLEVTLRTGNWARGFLSCVAEGVGSNGEGSNNESGEERPPSQEGTPSPPPLDDPFSFLRVTSQEVDSAEHGGPQGRRGTTCPCGMANKNGKRIFGGRETKVNEFPFLTGIGARGSGSMFCGSSILTPYHALTAAHCTYQADHMFDLILAEHDTRTADETSETKIVPVKRIIEHELYNPKTFLNDIALAVLENKLEFNQFISPICLPNNPLVLDGEYIKIIGWGRTEVTGRWMSTILRKVDMRVLPKRVCHALRPYMIPEGSPTQTCAYGNGKSACSGDSGGPLVWVDPETNRYTQIGLVSYGTSDCGTTMPRVSTDVTAFLDWIRRKVAETNPEGKICSKI